MTATIAEVALVMFVGMGPVKVLVYYLSTIHDVEADLARRVAVRAVTTATLTALALLGVGALLARLLHFSNAALVTAGGLILFGYGLHMALHASPAHRHDAPPSEAELRKIAIYPMGVPLILNPAGIAAATIFSAEAAAIGDLGVLAAIIVALGVLDLVVLVVIRLVGRWLETEIFFVLEHLLGVLLTAVAVELVVVGLAGFGILDLPPRT